MEGHFTFTFKDFIKILFLFGYVQYIIDLYCVHKYGRQICLEYFNIFDHIDKILGMEYYNNIRKLIIRTLITFTTFAVISTVFDVGAWYISSGSIFIAVNMFDYIYVILRQLTIADYIAQVTQIEYRLKFHENLLHDFYMMCETLPGVIKDIVAEKGMNKCRKRINSVQIIPDKIRILDQITRLGSCNLLILEQTAYTNSMYGIRVMAACLTILIDMIILMNVAIRILVGTIPQK
ncbi:uncharacterized protein [Epargyreus clarus]|uniref:uncharacterized protein n=1 Tax=Epargyreus clarus TaxID=520877 RepID=UPI003C2D07B3